MTADEHASFGTLLRRLRTAAGLTQQKLAERAGLSRRGIDDVERGTLAYSSSWETPMPLPWASTRHCCGRRLPRDPYERGHRRRSFAKMD